jgi:hypothetical protein
MTESGDDETLALEMIFQSIAERHSDIPCSDLQTLSDCTSPSVTNMYDGSDPNNQADVRWNVG